MHRTLKKLALLLVLLSLCLAPAHAGQATVTASDTSFALDTPPPGATQLRVRLLGSQTYFSFGWENTHTSDCWQTFQAEHAILIQDAGTTLVNDRIESAPQSDYAIAFDGTLNYDGPSGASWTETKQKSATFWGAWHTGLPTTLDVVRRKDLLYDPPCGSMSTFDYVQSSCIVEWEWQ